MDDTDNELIDLSTWQQKLNELAAEESDTQIRLPPRSKVRRVNREEVAQAFVHSFELVGGIPRLAYWADSNYGDFIKIFGRLLPKETLQVHDGEVVIRHAVAPSALDEEDGDTSSTKGKLLTFPQKTPEG